MAINNRIKYLVLFGWYLLLANTTFAFSRQDTLRGSNGNGRDWWDVLHYDLSVKFDTANQSINGVNTITFRFIKPMRDSMQIDLQELMFLDSIVTMTGTHLDFVKEGNVWWVDPHKLPIQNSDQIRINVYYHGKPRVAKLPPWDGGFIWSRDSMGKAWISVACQGLGASAWWPCKDQQSDEPDNGMNLNFTIPNGLVCVSNGKLLSKNAAGENTQWSYQVKNPINTYNATFYIGDYVTWHDTLNGEKGILDISYTALRYNEAKAKKHFAVVKPMLHCFEHWMGPYPFYEDGYKLVEAPFFGMEHQSAIAYGNKYVLGYKGMDRSGNGPGLLFDYIIIHESGHEWYGNNITAEDIADNWIQEGFTTYTETLFVECAFGKKKAFDYVRGEWRNIQNDVPVIGAYGVNDDGSGDKYDKGAAVVHMIRMMMNDDEKFRNMLREMNKTYYHKTVSSREIEQFIMKYSGLQLQPFFDQYLRTTNIPDFEWYVKNKRLYYRFSNVTEGFSLPVTITSRKKEEKLNVTTEWKDVKWKKGGYNIHISEDFLIRLKP
jgi:aminopeptidase N